MQTDPRCGEAPTEPTEFKVMYDDKNLYVLVRCHDAKAAGIDRRVARRDEVDGDNVAVYIDSYFDKRTAFGFKVNAAGVKGDAALSGDSLDQDFTWDPVWAVKTAVDAGGWTAEMAIPFSQLRFAGRDELTFGLQVQALPLPQPGALLVAAHRQGRPGLRPPLRRAAGAEGDQGPAPGRDHPLRRGQGAVLAQGSRQPLRHRQQRPACWAASTARSA